MKKPVRSPKSKQESDLTPRQRHVLSFLRDAITRRGVPPSIREIGKALNISSLRGVTDHLNALEMKGYIRRESHARGIVLTRHHDAQRKGSLVPVPVRIPIVGRVPAGQAFLAEEEVDGFLESPAVEWGEGCFALKVKGDSMIEAGILDGDIVIVRPQPEANNGDIVVARINDEATVKRFFRERTRIRLQPENAQLEPIYISPQEAEVVIVGKVVGVQRRLS